MLLLPRGSGGSVQIKMLRQSNQLEENDLPSSSSRVESKPLHEMMINSCAEDVDVDVEHENRLVRSCAEYYIGGCNVNNWNCSESQSGNKRCGTIMERRSCSISSLGLLLCVMFTMSSSVAAWSQPPIHTALEVKDRPPPSSMIIGPRVRMPTMALYASTSRQPPKQSMRRSREVQVSDSDVNDDADQSILNTLNSQLLSIRQSIRQTDRKTAGTSTTSQPLDTLTKMLSYYISNDLSNSTDYATNSKATAFLDEAFNTVTTFAFSTPYNLDKIQLGMAAIQLFLHPEKHEAVAASTVIVQHSFQYEITRGIWLKALRALTSRQINSSRPSIPSLCNYTENKMWITTADAAFQMLQRFITGQGVRQQNRINVNHDRGNKQQKRHRPQQYHNNIFSLDERDFNMVLHAYASTHQMLAAHRVLALQERLRPRAPPLSPVAYSILLKAYGRKGDIKNVEICIGHAQRNRVQPDIVMANTVLDAYVNCGLMDKAETLFYSLRGDSVNNNAAEEDDAMYTSADYYWPRLRPNVRTYNTILKGMAIEGQINKAIQISQVMKDKQLWDDITTNTLVKVAVTAQEFEVAEEILANHTTTTTSFKSRSHHHRNNDDHPNIEAYTELIDGYAKDGQLSKSLQVMQHMQTRGVSPNEYTYTCIVGALARANKVRQAKKMMDYVTSLNYPFSSRGKKVLTPIFNAFISGLLQSGGHDGSNYDNIDDSLLGGAQSSHSLNILEALNTLREMEKLDVYPNVVTVTLLIDGLANCNPPRCTEARDLVQHLELTHQARQSYRSNNYSNRISLSNVRIGTALIRAYGRVNDVESSRDAFRSISKPDVIALNALLDACCKSSQLKLAYELFETYSSFQKWKNDERIVVNGEEAKSICKAIQPDVVTYTTLIVAILSLKNKNASKRAAQLYNEMKQIWRIYPDTILIDK